MNYKLISCLSTHASFSYDENKMRNKNIVLNLKRNLLTFMRLHESSLNGAAIIVLGEKFSSLESPRNACVDLFVFSDHDADRVVLKEGINAIFQKKFFSDLSFSVSEMTFAKLSLVYSVNKIYLCGDESVFLSAEKEFLKGFPDFQKPTFQGLDAHISDLPEAVSKMMLYFKKINPDAHSLFEDVDSDPLSRMYLLFHLNQLDLNDSAIDHLSLSYKAFLKNKYL